MLNYQKAQKFVQAWLKDHNAGEHGETYVRQMVAEVYEELGNAALENREPRSNTKGLWHDNQCVLLGILMHGA